nr:neuropeptide-like protein 29 [Procambarus clarkii]
MKVLYLVLVVALAALMGSARAMPDPYALAGPDPYAEADPAADPHWRRRFGGFGGFGGYGGYGRGFGGYGGYGFYG